MVINQSIVQNNQLTRWQINFVQLVRDRLNWQHLKSNTIFKFDKKYDRIRALEDTHCSLVFIDHFTVVYFNLFDPVTILIICINLYLMLIIGY